MNADDQTVGADFIESYDRNFSRAFGQFGFSFRLRFSLAKPGPDTVRHPLAHFNVHGRVIGVILRLLRVGVCERAG